LRKELVEQDMLRIKKAGVLAFPEISVVSDHDEGILTVAQANGFAGLDSNTVLLGLRDVSAPGAPGDLARLVTLTRKFDAMGKCTLIRCSRPSNPTQNAGPIVLWWAGRHNNGDLMLLLAHLMTVSSAWRRSVIHLKSIVSNEEEAEVRRAQFSKMLPDIRIAVKVKVIVMEEGRSTADLIVQNSAGAAIVMLGMKLADAGEEEQYAEQVHGLLARLPTTLLVRNAGEFRGRLI
jgi:hypothetical protein